MTASTRWSPPFREFTCRVGEASIDYNGHMNDAAYAQVLTDANEVFLDALGMSASYRERTGCSLYTVEMTIRFKREVSLGDTLRAETYLASHDTKRVGVHTVLLDDEGRTVATGDTLYLHVDTAAGAVRTFPDDRAVLLEQVKHAHAEALPAR